MQVVTRPGELNTQGRNVNVAVGMFDGVHLGHQRLLQLALDQARKHSGLAVAVTFDRHPNTILAPEHAPLLLQTLDHRIALLEQLHLDATIVIPFDLAFSNIAAGTFVRQLTEDLGCIKSVSVGQGFTFGHRRGGDVDLLEQLGHKLGFLTLALAPVCLGNDVIRSTRIRELVAAGQLAQANAMLGRPYSIASRVIHGDQLGRKMGFPTANLDIQNLIVPPSGVYAAKVILNGRPEPAVLNIGHRPTLDQPTPQLRLEVHLLDFQGDLYGQTLETVFEQQLRSEQRFSSLDGLQQQIQKDIAQTRTVLGCSQ